MGCTLMLLPRSGSLSTYGMGQSRELQNSEIHKSPFVWGAPGLEGYSMKFLKTPLGLRKGGRRVRYSLPL